MRDTELDQKTDAAEPETTSDDVALAEMEDAAPEQKVGNPAASDIC